MISLAVSLLIAFGFVGIGFGLWRVRCFDYIEEQFLGLFALGIGSVLFIAGVTLSLIYLT